VINTLFYKKISICAILNVLSYVIVRTVHEAA
jgi:hypothetical protein